VPKKLDLVLKFSPQLRFSAADAAFVDDNFRTKARFFDNFPHLRLPVGTLPGDISKQVVYTCASVHQAV